MDTFILGWTSTSVVMGSHIGNALRSILCESFITTLQICFFFSVMNYQVCVQVHFICELFSPVCDLVLCMDKHVNVSKSLFI